MSASLLDVEGMVDEERDGEQADLRESGEEGGGEVIMCWDLRMGGHENFCE